jgi:hypothetical protein
MSLNQPDSGAFLRKWGGPGEPPFDRILPKVIFCFRTVMRRFELFSLVSAVGLEPTTP